MDRLSNYGGINFRWLPEDFPKMIRDIVATERKNSVVPGEVGPLFEELHTDILLDLTNVRGGNMSAERATEGLLAKLEEAQSDHPDLPTWDRLRCLLFTGLRFMDRLDQAIIAAACIRDVALSANLISELDNVESMVAYCRGVGECIATRGEPERALEFLRHARAAGLIQHSYDRTGPEIDNLIRARVDDYDAFQDWADHPTFLETPYWHEMAALAADEPSWGGKMPIIERQFVASYAAAFQSDVLQLSAMSTKSAMSAKSVEKLRRLLAANDEIGANLASDHLRMLTAVLLLQEEHTRFGYKIMDDITQPVFRAEAVQRLLGANRQVEAMAVTLETPDPELVTHLLLYAPWSTPTDGTGMLERITLPFDAKNINTYPPKLRIGCMQALSAIHAGVGNEASAQLYAGRAETSLRQIEGGFLRYRPPKGAKKGIR